jgi:hypothetical protein
VGLEMQNRGESGGKLKYQEIFKRMVSLGLDAFLKGFGKFSF